MSALAQNSVLTHVYRVRPTTVDQKRTLTRGKSKHFSNRPATVNSKLRNAHGELKATQENNEYEEQDENFIQNEQNEGNLSDNVLDSPVGSEDEIDIHNEEKWETDIEDEEEKSKDFTCQGIYLELCKKNKLIPASYFVRHMNDPDLKMRHHGLGAPGIKPVAVALTTNTRVVKLDISDNWLGSMGAEHICKMMRDNCYITELNLSDNHLGTHGSTHVYDMLKQNNTLTHLILQGNNFDDSSAEIWADIILNTNKIEYLDLSHNSFGEISGKLFGPAISENTSIKTLILSWNNFRNKGAVALAKGLQTNIYMKKFDISWNGIAQDGCKTFWKTLKENEYLEELDISNNRIAAEGAVFISKGLMTNQALKVLKMAKNPMESAGCFAIIKGLQKNQSSKIEEIDFSEILVDKFFIEELDAFRTMYPDVAIKTGCDNLKLKPKNKLHPIIKLKNFMDKHKIKLIDFFNRFDKDGSLSVSHEEFIMGIDELGIKFDEADIKLLIAELDEDGDGEINYSEVKIKMRKNGA